MFKHNFIGEGEFLNTSSVDGGGKSQRDSVVLVQFRAGMLLTRGKK